MSVQSCLLAAHLNCTLFMTNGIGDWTFHCAIKDGLSRVALKVDQPLCVILKPLNYRLIKSHACVKNMSYVRLCSFLKHCGNELKTLFLGNSGWK